MKLFYHLCKERMEIVETKQGNNPREVLLFVKEKEECLNTVFVIDAVSTLSGLGTTVAHIQRLGGIIVWRIIQNKIVCNYGNRTTTTNIELVYLIQVYHTETFLKQF